MTKVNVNINFSTS